MNLHDTQENFFNHRFSLFIKFDILDFLFIFISLSNDFRPGCMQFNVQILQKPVTKFNRWSLFKSKFEIEITFTNVIIFLVNEKVLNPEFLISGNFLAMVVYVFEPVNRTFVSFLNFIQVQGLQSLTVTIININSIINVRKKSKLNIKTQFILNLNFLFGFN